MTFFNITHSQITILVSLVFFSVSCSQSEYDSRLLEAESLMEEYPDSSVIILKRIDKNVLSMDDRNLYDLIDVRLSDKFHKDISSDTIISQTAEYFLTKEDRKRAMMALYCEGRVRYALEEFSRAMLAFHQALTLATELDDRFIAGMSCRGIGDIYNKSFNSGEELYYAKEEYRHILKSGKQPYINYALLDLAISYSANFQYNNSSVKMN